MCVKLVTATTFSTEVQPDTAGFGVQHLLWHLFGALRCVEDLRGAYIFVRIMELFGFAKIFFSLRFSTPLPKEIFFVRVVLSPEGRSLDFGERRNFRESRPFPKNQPSLSRIHMSRTEGNRGKWEGF